MKMLLVIFSCLVIPFSVHAQGGGDNKINYYNGAFLGLHLSRDGCVSLHLSKFGKYIQDFTDKSSASTFTYLARSTATVLSELDRILYLLTYEPAGVEVQKDEKGLKLAYRNNGDEHQYFINAETLEQVRGDYRAYIKGQMEFFDGLNQRLKEIYPVEEEALFNLLVTEDAEFKVDNSISFTTILNIERIQNIKEVYLLPYFSFGESFPVILNQRNSFVTQPSYSMTGADVLRALNEFLPNHYRADDMEKALDNFILYVINNNAVVDMDKAKLVIFGDPDINGASSIMDYLIRTEYGDQHMLAVIQLLSWMAYYNDWYKDRYICTAVRRALFYNGIINSVINIPERVNKIEQDLGFRLPNSMMVEQGMGKYNVYIRR